MIVIGRASWHCERLRSWPQTVLAYSSPPKDCFNSIVMWPLREWILHMQIKLMNEIGVGSGKMYALLNVCLRFTSIQQQCQLETGPPSLAKEREAR